MTVTADPSVPLPAGAAYGDDWQQHPDKPHPVVCGVNRGVLGDEALVWSYVRQFADGTVDDGTFREAPGVSVDVQWERGLSIPQARELAAAILAAAEEVDGWVAR